MRAFHLDYEVYAYPFRPQDTAEWSKWISSGAQVVSP